MEGSRWNPRELSTLMLILLLALSTGASATQPPREGGEWPEDFREEIRTFQNEASFSQLATRIRNNRAAIARGEMTLASAFDFGGVMIEGRKDIPVLTVLFENDDSAPYPSSDLQERLFDGPWPTGTVTDYFAEVSYQRFTVSGDVSCWRKLSRGDTFYEAGPGGAPTCRGVCTTARLGDLLKETFDLNDPAVDFAAYDNDGPDGQPNSGDDDGRVDFVAIVHPESGGECNSASTNIWSHQWVYSRWTGTGPYQTNDPRHSGGFIEIDNYFIMPALACNGTDIVSIGVFAHEFAHAFGLPDLYDTTPLPPAQPDSEGIGNWGLMAGGSWGGDGRSPERPVHLSVWAKEFLGWVRPTEVTSDLDPAFIDDIESQPEAFRITIDQDRHYLISNRQQTGFDAGLPGSGLLVWRIDEEVIRQSLDGNRINADENAKGVALLEADGLGELDDRSSPGDDGDPFPGRTSARSFDRDSSPAAESSIAICEISDSMPTMTAQLILTGGVCP